MSRAFRRSARIAAASVLTPVLVLSAGAAHADAAYYRDLTSTAEELPDLDAGHATWLGASTAADLVKRVDRQFPQRGQCHQR